MGKKLAFSTKSKNLINSVLKPVGFQVTTTLAERIELDRIARWQASEKWARPVYAAGLDLDKDRHLQFLNETCVPFNPELAAIPLHSENGSDGFYLSNTYFEFLDADVLYCLIRHLGPKHIVEVGSGHSTKLMSKAITTGNQRTRITSIDPNPRADIRKFADEWIQSRVEDLESSRVADNLSAGDILFIDSSHNIVTGGDVPYLLLEVLPKLARGVYIHLHDIFLPFDYTQKIAAEKRWGWTEQYLVHAFLYRNTDFEIVWPSRYMWEYSRDELKAALPNLDATNVPTSLWLRKTA